jgi:hypothetical protein
MNEFCETSFTISDLSCDCIIACFIKPVIDFADTGKYNGLM